MDTETYRTHFLRWWEEIGKKQADNHQNAMDTGTYRAHFLEWWKEEGRKQTEKEAKPMVTIHKRMEEISNMVRKPKETNCLDYLKDELKEKVEKYKEIPSSKFTSKRRLKEWKPGEKFRYAIRMIRLLVRACLISKAYLLEERRKSIQIDGDAIDVLNSSRDSENLSQINLKKRTAVKSNLRLEFMIDLITQPHLRDQRAIRRIKWLLGYLKVFKDVISSDMEHELALRVGFEQYEPGRVIARQGRMPERLYYVISGQMDLVREYSLDSGLFTKSVGTLKRGMTTDVEEFKHQWLRETSLVCKRNLQVLVLHKQDYFFLTSTEFEPPVEFLRTLSFFADFPFEKLQEAPRSIDCKYYSQNQVVVTDINTLDWMYVIKSGKCDCIRRQHIIDVKQEMEQFAKKKSKNRTLGTKVLQNSTVHSKRKISGLLKQEKLTAKLKADKSSSRQKSSQALNHHKKETRKDIYDLPPLAFGAKDSGIFIHSGGRHGEEEQTVPKNDRKSNGDYQISRQPTLNVLPLKRVFLAVDVLKSGDIFGLNGISGVLHDTTHANVSVVSAKGGAEIIRINKRFFRRNASLTVLLKLETQHREYIEEEEALQYLAERDNWAHYKKILMGNLR